MNSLDFQLSQIRNKLECETAAQRALNLVRSYGVVLSNDARKQIVSGTIADIAAVIPGSPMPLAYDNPDQRIAGVRKTLRRLGRAKGAITTLANFGVALPDNLIDEVKSETINAIALAACEEMV